MYIYKSMYLTFYIFLYLYLNIHLYIWPTGAINDFQRLPWGAHHAFPS